MASIDVGGAGGGKKRVDSEISLIPFIDLLLCCVMFLLVTAVWSQLADVQVTQRAEGGSEQGAVEYPAEELSVYVQVGAEKITVASTAGESVELSGELHSLAEHLRLRRTLDRTDTPVVVSADDGIGFERVLGAIDRVKGAGYDSVIVSKDTLL